MDHVAHPPRVQQFLNYLQFERHFSAYTSRCYGADLRQFLVRVNTDFRDKAPVSAAEAATIILDGIRAGAWRILIGQDAKIIDERVRAKSEAAYDYAELFAGLGTGDGQSN